MTVLSLLFLSDYTKHVKKEYDCTKPTDSIRYARHVTMNVTALRLLFLSDYTIPVCRETCPEISTRFCHLFKANKMKRDDRVIRHMGWGISIWAKEFCIMNLSRLFGVAVCVWVHKLTWCRQNMTEATAFTKQCLCDWLRVCNISCPLMWIVLHFCNTEV